MSVRQRAVHEANGSQTLPAVQAANLDALQRFARRVPVFPCNPETKAPLVDGGFNAASCYSQKIERWWTQWPDALVGVPTGKTSDLTVFDVDSYKDDEATSLWVQENSAVLMAARVHSTAHGGRHYLFRSNGHGIKSSNGVSLNGTKLAGLDVKAEGGYVIWWPLHGLPIYGEDKAPELPNELARQFGVSKPAAITNDENVLLLQVRGLYIKELEAGKHAIVCPWQNEHSMAGGNSETVYWSANYNGREKPGFKCQHAHCSHRTVRNLLAWLHPTISTDAQHTGFEGVEIASVCIADVEPKPLHWLWKNRIPLGKLTLIAGDPGLGKSLLGVAFAATVTRGVKWPDGAECDAGDVLFISGEDDIADTLRPRLDATGADVNRIHQVRHVVDVEGNRPFCLADVAPLETLIQSMHEPALIVIDPISEFMGPTDTHKNADVRAILRPLQELAQRTGTAIVAITHLNKGAGAAIYRTTGSLAFVAAARAVFAVAKDKDNPARRLFLPVKCNLSADQTGLAYTIAPNVTGDVVVQWEPGTITTDADYLLSGPQNAEERSAVQDAADWLRSELVGDPVASKALFANARRDGHTDITLRRAKTAIGAKAKKESGKWVWELPK